MTNFYKKLENIKNPVLIETHDRHNEISFYILYPNGKLEQIWFLLNGSKICYDEHRFSSTIKQALFDFFNINDKGKLLFVLNELENHNKLCKKKIVAVYQL